MMAYRFRGARMWIIIPSYTVFGASIFAAVLASVLVTRGIVRRETRTLIIERSVREWPNWDEKMPLRGVLWTDYTDGWHRMYYDWAAQPPRLRPIAREWMWED